ncbi:MAG: glycoside hydrolase family 127 protein, partial [Bacteroidota bacterium]|nr:glycoside hydrolase family 127 protein [Bacteroidota bacterium]
PMEATLIEANPLVEETRNQVTVKRGPVVYCLESADMPKDKKIFNVAIPAKMQFTPRLIKIGNSELMALEGKAKLVENADWKNTLYKEVSQKDPADISVRLIPYYAWGNRGHAEMTVWMPVSR